MTTAIVGSGFAGIATAHGLNKIGYPNTIFESRSVWGGHTHADEWNGFRFDEGPHLSFTKDERVREIFARGAGEVVELSARITNYFEGHWVRHPAQVHLHGLDPDLVTQCITDFVEAQQNPPKVETYADWLVAMYGKTFAERFPFRYTRKYWTVEPSQLGIDWVGQRMYPPKLDEILRGAHAPDNEGDFHYLKSYRYPANGGYQSFMNELAKGADIRLNKEVARIDVTNKTLRFSDGGTAPYDSIVSTTPLDVLVRCIEGREVPAEILAAASELLCTSVVLIDIAVDRHELFDYQWFYVYDEDISFSRVHFPHMLSPSMAPSGKGSIQAEVYFSRHKPLENSLDELVDRVVNEFIELKILRNREEVLFARHRTIPYANIVFDHRRGPALELIKPFVEECGITLAGRFGEWDYHWTDDATNADWKAAATICNITVDEMLGRRSQGELGDVTQ